MGEGACAKRYGVVRIARKHLYKTDDRGGELTDHQDLFEAFEAFFVLCGQIGLDRKARLEGADAFFKALDDLFFALFEDRRDDLEQAAFAVIEGFAPALCGFCIDHAKAHEFSETLGDESRGKSEFNGDLTLAHGGFVIKECGPDPSEVWLKTEAIEKLGKDRKDFFAWGVFMYGGIRHVGRVVCC